MSSYRVSRNVAYPKKRPSPHGISKSHKTPILGPPPPGRKLPYSAKSALLQQRQREAHLAALRRQGVLIEEEYREDIRLYMHEMEVGQFPVRYCLSLIDVGAVAVRPPQKYTMSSSQSMDQQPEIRWHMRPCLVDFLVEIHFAFRLRPETLYLTLNIVDRYVSRRIVYIKHYQLVGCAALWVAAKFEDAKERVPTVQELAQICRDTYDESAFIQMEGHVLATIQWTLGHPTAEAWLRLMCCDPFVEEDKVQHVARFLMEITLFYREFIKYAPSSIALGALTLARFLCGKPRRIFEETAECREIVDLLDNRLSTPVNNLSETLVKKYSYAFYSKAATFVLQFYFQGGRFSWHQIVPFPVTPTRSPVSGTSTPTSDISDDFPLTPTSPVSFSSDPFPGSPSSDDDKENLPTFEPVVNKQRLEEPPDQYLPHEYLTFSRLALHNLNGSPRVAAVS